MVKWNDGSENCKGKVCLSVSVAMEDKDDHDGIIYGGIISFGREKPIDFEYTIRETSSAQDIGLEDTEMTLVDPQGIELTLDGELGDIFKQIAYESVVTYQRNMHSEEVQAKMMIAGLLAASMGAEAVIPVAKMGSCIEVKPELEDFLDRCKDIQNKSMPLNEYLATYRIDPTGGDIQ